MRYSAQLQYIVQKYSLMGVTWASSRTGVLSTVTGLCESSSRSLRKYSRRAPPCHYRVGIPQEEGGGQVVRREEGGGEE